MTIPSILFFDSGVGGFSVYREARKILPNAHFLYCFDNGGFPYSEQTEANIIWRTVAICRKINDLYPLDAIVIACNTASTVVLPPLREIFSIPIIGTVPAIKPAAEISQTQHIGLLATKGTVKRAYVDNLIEKFAQHCRVEKLGSTKLVQFAEQKLRGKPIDLNELNAELRNWREMPDLDSVCLGCTHFPLIQEEIAQCLPQVKNWLDPGAAIAKRLKHLLDKAIIADKNAPQNQIFCTAPMQNVGTFLDNLPNWGFSTLNELTIAFN